jgi:integrase
MPRKAKELTALDVRRLKARGTHAVGGVAGLLLQITTTGARSWILRTMVGDKRREIGLGAYPDVTLAQAREKARGTRQTVEEGRDPVAERAAARSALIAARGLETTFDEATRRFLESKSSEWRNPKHAAQWETTLRTYASPNIGKLHVRDVSLGHIAKIMEPIWTTKTETASRVRGRIESVLDWATVHGYREGENPARWKGHLDKILPKPSKVSTVEHHAALPHWEICAFVADLQKREGIAARALEVLILTACRSNDVRGTTWSELDLASRVWIIPGPRMKAKKEHRIPLSQRVIEIVEGLPRKVDNSLVFPAPRGGILSDMTLGAVLKRMGREDLTAHGFRSTFRDWAGETTAYPREVIEHALANQLKDKAEAAYARGTLFEKRRSLMDDWAEQCATVSKRDDEPDRSPNRAASSSASLPT